MSGAVFSLSGISVLFQYFANNFSLFLVYSWMLPYLQQHFQLGSGRASVYSGLPIYCGVIAAWVGGIIVDFLFRHGFHSWSRALPAIAGFVVASAGIALAGMSAKSEVFIVWFAVVVLGLDLTVRSSWTICADIGGEHTGTVSGMMNMMGALGSFACSVSFSVRPETFRPIRGVFLGRGSAGRGCGFLLARDRPVPFESQRRPFNGKTGYCRPALVHSVYTH